MPKKTKKSAVKNVSMKTLLKRIEALEEAVKRLGEVAALSSYSVTSFSDSCSGMGESYVLEGGDLSTDVAE